MGDGLSLPREAHAGTSTKICHTLYVHKFLYSNVSWNIRNVNINQALYGLPRPLYAEEVWQFKTVFGSRYISVTVIKCSLFVMYITTHYKGVEKNDSKRHYFSSNKHDAPGEIIRSVDRKHCSRVYGVIPPVYAIREATTKTAYWNKEVFRL